MIFYEDTSYYEQTAQEIFFLFTYEKKTESCLPCPPPPLSEALTTIPQKTPTTPTRKRVRALESIHSNLGAY